MAASETLKCLNFIHVNIYMTADTRRTLRGGVWSLTFPQHWPKCITEDPHWKVSKLNPTSLKHRPVGPDGLGRLIHRTIVAASRSLKLSFHSDFFLSSFIYDHSKTIMCFKLTHTLCLKIPNQTLKFLTYFFSLIFVWI